MQVVTAKIDYAPPVGCGDCGVIYVPLKRHLPVKYPGSARHLVNDHRNALAKHPQGLAHAVAGDAAADGVHLGRSLVQLLADGVAHVETGARWRSANCASY